MHVHAPNAYAQPASRDAVLQHPGINNAVADRDGATTLTAPCARLAPSAARSAEAAEGPRQGAHCGAQGTDLPTRTTERAACPVMQDAMQVAMQLRDSVLPFNVVPYRAMLQRLAGVLPTSRPPLRGARISGLTRGEGVPRDGDIAADGEGVMP